MRLIPVTLSLLALAGCAAEGGGSSLVSTQYPPGAVSANSEPELASSLPQGASNRSASPNASAPDFGSVTIGRRSGF